MFESLQEERLSAITDQVNRLKPKSVLDLGCGPAELILYLAKLDFISHIVGIDLSSEELNKARSVIHSNPQRDTLIIEFQKSSFLNKHEIPQGFDIAIMMETIEHVDPKHLSQLEQAVFRASNPKAVIITTPNKEYNSIFGMREGQMRHLDHFFEWDRQKFFDWSEGVSRRQGYSFEIKGIGPFDEFCGHPTQMAIFEKNF